MSELRGNVSQEHYDLAVKEKGSKPINPIGTCFDSAALQLIHGKTPPELSDLKLCHGITISTMPGQEGRKIAHAWLEYKMNGVETAWDTTWNDVASKKQYREEVNLHHIVEYTKEEAWSLWAKHDYPGPWDRKIKEVVYANINSR